MTYIIIAGIVVLIVFSSWYAKKVDQNPNHPYKPSYQKSRSTTMTIADNPINFGYKCMWFAIKTTKQQEVAEIVGVTHLVKSNWENGIKEAYNKSIFITPVINDWTLVVGWGLPRGDSKDSLQKIKKLITALSARFGEAQFFCTHRVIEYHCWMKSMHGNIDRVYSYHGELGENPNIYGDPTEIELRYNLVDASSKETQPNDSSNNEDLTYPNEEFVMKIARDWSIDPSTLDDKKYPKSLGMIGFLRQ